MTIQLLTGFQLRVGGADIGLQAGAQRLVVFLALRGGAVSRVQVIETLWQRPGADSRVAASLRTKLWRVNRQAGAEIVVASGADLALADGVGVDVHAAVRAARRLIDPADPWCPAPAEMVRAGLVHDLLPGNADPWAVVEHEAFHQLRLHALESLSLRLVAAGRLTEAVEAAGLAVDGNPLRESAQRILITAHLAAGQYGAARERYFDYRRLLRERLSLAPSPSFEELLGGEEKAG